MLIRYLLHTCLVNIWVSNKCNTLTYLVVYKLFSQLRSLPISFPEITLVSKSVSKFSLIKHTACIYEYFVLSILICIVNI